MPFGLSERCLAASIPESGGFTFFLCVLTFCIMFAVLFAFVSKFRTSMPTRHVRAASGTVHHVYTAFRNSHLQLPGMSLHHYCGSYYPFQRCSTRLQCRSSLSTHLPGRLTSPLHLQARSHHLHAIVCLQNIRAHSHTDVIPGPGTPTSNRLHYNRHDSLR